MVIHQSFPEQSSPSRKLSWEWEEIPDRPTRPVRFEEDALYDSITNPKPARQIDKKSSHRIIRSQFLNFGNKGEEIEVELTVGQDISPKPEDAPDPLFRWIHIHGETMDFDDFLEVAIQSPELFTSEKRIIKQHLENLRKLHEKTLVTPNGNKGCYMEPVVLQDLSLQPNSSQSYLDTTVLALCLPYFLLDKYSPNSEPSKSTKHPPRTLLQYLMSSTGRERDMRQAVCKVSFARIGHCYHVSQLWCLVLNDKLMITCTRVDDRLLCGSSIKITTQPTPGFPHIQVTDGGNCFWQLHLEDCPTWHAFTTHFMEIKTSSDGFMNKFENRFRVSMKGKTVTADNWPAILSKAKESTVRLVLSRKRPASPYNILTESLGIEDDESAPESEIDFPWQMEHSPPPPPDKEPFDLQAFEQHLENGGNPQDFSNPINLGGPRIVVENPISESEHQLINDFRVFPWMSIQKSALKVSNQHSEQEQQVGVVDQETLKAKLDEIHQILLQNKTYEEKKVYQDCQEKSLPEVVKHIALVTCSERELISGMSFLDKFFVAATDMFELFMPLTVETPVGFRYWGAIHFIIRKIIPRDRENRSLIKSIEKFIHVAELAKTIRQERSSANSPKPDHAELPQELPAAWLHCVVCLVLFQAKVKNARDIDYHIDQCQQLLNRGRQVLARKLVKTKLEKKEVAVPQAVSSVLIYHLLKDIIRDSDQLDQLDKSKKSEKPDVHTTYWQYWKQLDTEVRNGRLQRAQPEISDLKQEITAVTKTLEDQLYVLEKLHQAIRSQREGWSSLHNFDKAPKREIPLIKECILHVENRIESFKQLNTRAVELENWNSQRIASTKDRHDKAIYAFTIVTIIFLPLSFVSGFLGMNTTDIRNSGAKQWVFWASAVPLTAAVILIALLWAGELGNAWTAAAELFHMLSRSLGYVQIPGRSSKSYASGVKRKNLSVSPPFPMPGPPSRAPTFRAQEVSYRTNTFDSTL